MLCCRAASGIPWRDMKKEEYVQRVLKQLTLVTSREEEAIRQELAGHIEDHMADLLDLGYDETLAEERTMACMGDPEEVGRELQKQYPLGWMVVADIARILAFCLIVFLIIFPRDGSVLKAIAMHINPPVMARELKEPDAELLLDERIPVGNDVLRLVWITRKGNEAELYAVSYDRWPLGRVGDMDLQLETESGSGVARNTGVWFNPWYSWHNLRVSLAPEDTDVTLSCTRYGNTIEYCIPLPEVTE